jgi:hypothetical protein
VSRLKSRRITAGHVQNRQCILLIMMLGLRPTPPLHTITNGLVAAAADKDPTQEVICAGIGTGSACCLS